MKKETIAAIFLGVTLGVVGALVMIGKAKEFSVSKTKTLTGSQSVSPSPFQKEPGGQLLEDVKPVTLSLFEANSITITGRASQNALVVIQSPISDVTLKNEKETFSTKFPLALGENIIELTVYPTDTKIPPQSKTIKVYYLDEK